MRNRNKKDGQAQRQGKRRRGDPPTLRLRLPARSRFGEGRARQARLDETPARQARLDETSARQGLGNGKSKIRNEKMVEIKEHEMLSEKAGKYYRNDRSLSFLYK